MPQFDYLIILNMVIDLIIILIFYYILFFAINIRNLTNIKFRKKISKFDFKIFCFSTIF